MPTHATEEEAVVVDGTPRGVARDYTDDGFDGTPQGIAVENPNPDSIPQGIAVEDKAIDDCGFGPQMFQVRPRPGKGRGKSGRGADTD